MYGRERHLDDFTLNWFNMFVHDAANCYELARLTINDAKDIIQKAPPESELHDLNSRIDIAIQSIDNLRVLFFAESNLIYGGSHDEPTECCLIEDLAKSALRMASKALMGKIGVPVRLVKIHPSELRILLRGQNVGVLRIALARLIYTHIVHLRAVSNPEEACLVRAIVEGSPMQANADMTITVSYRSRLVSLTQPEQVAESLEGAADLSLASLTQLEQVAGTNAEQVAESLGGRFRWKFQQYPRGRGLEITYDVSLPRGC